LELTGGNKLRALRESLGCTMRDVESASQQISVRLGSDEYIIPPSRLSDIETKGVVPSIFRLYSLAAIYRCEYRELLFWYGIDLNDVLLDSGVAHPPKSHVSHVAENLEQVAIPVHMDPGFNPQKTTNFGRMIEKWGIVPLSYLSAFSAVERYTYGYIGSEDYTMYPLLPPGSFVQVDETQCKAQEAAWRSEWERPIYFIETRDGYVCCWCRVQGENIVLQPHPLSPVPVRVVRHPQDAEIIGQVVAVAMRLGDWRALGPPLEPTGCATPP
jgi:transcriptional regulator with XRE-family HTH domain